VREDEATPPSASIYEPRKEKGRDVWFCTVTKSSCPLPPTVPRGGLLADDMGLGKTLTTLALIATSPPAGVSFNAPAERPSSPQKAASPEKPLAAVEEKPLLGPWVCCDGCDKWRQLRAEPSATLPDQWFCALSDDPLRSSCDAAESAAAAEEFDEEEEERSAKKLKVGELRTELAAHGADEGGTKPKLVARLVNAKRAAFEAEANAKALALGRAAALAEEEARAAAEVKKETRLPPPKPAPVRPPTVHAAGCGGTLVVCPTSVLANWAEQIAQHLPPGALRVLKHHGTTRAEDAAALATADVVLTTYGTLAHEWSRHIKPSASGAPLQPLDPIGGQVGAKRKAHRPASVFELEWHRVVLDEAHTIRSKKTQASKGALAIRAKKRWALTGTPFVNRCEDLQPYFEFIGAPPASDLALYKRTVSGPVRQGDASGLSCLRVMLQAVSLRRTKALLSATLPKASVELHYVPLQEEGHGGEADYDAVHAAAAGAVRAIAGAAGAGASLLIIETILRLRQMCVMPGLVPKPRIARAHALVEQLASLGAEALSPDKARATLNGLSGEEAKAAEAARAAASAAARSADGDGEADATQADEDGAEAMVEEYDCAAPALKGLAVPVKVEQLALLVRALPPDERCVVFSQFT